MTDDKPAVEALADAWAANYEWGRSSGYEEGRGDQLDACEQELRDAIAADRAAGRLVAPTEPSSSSGYGRWPTTPAGSAATPEQRAAWRDRASRLKRFYFDDELPVEFIRPSDLLALLDALDAAEARAEKTERELVRTMSERNRWHEAVLIAANEREAIGQRAEADRVSAYARGRDEALAEVEMRLADDGIDGTTVVRELRERSES